VRGCVAALRYARTLSPGAHESINIGNDHPIAVLDLARKMNRIAVDLGMLDEPVPVLVRQKDLYSETFDDEWHRQPDLSRAGQLLGYAPLVPMEEGLVETLRWARGLAGSAD